ncbi:MAG: hypothetical protein WCI05_11790 [Myxococcales bacterium]|jgi:hypothetical protein
MSFNLDNLPAAARVRYIKIGRLYGSEDTLKQANATLQALEQHGAKLTRHAFNAADAERLTEARDGLVASGVGREHKKVAKKTTSKTFVAALQGAKDARNTGRDVLDAGHDVLLESNAPEAEAVARSVQVVLQATSAAGDDVERLAQQLDAIRSELLRPEVAAVVKDREGPAAVTELEERAAALRAAAAVRPVERGTPAETEQLDLLDGIIVTLCRRARKAARGAAKRLGQDALASAFELRALSRGRTGAVEPTGNDVAKAGGGASPAEKPAVASPADATKATVTGGH